MLGFGKGLVLNGSCNSFNKDPKTGSDRPSKLKKVKMSQLLVEVNCLVWKRYVHCSHFNIIVFFE